MTSRALFLVVSSSLLLSACSSTFEGLQEDWTSLSTATSERFSKLTQPQTTHTEGEKENALNSVKADNQCPEIVIDPQFDSLSEYDDMKKPSESNLISKASLTGITSNCKVSADAQMLEMRLDLKIESALGAKARRTDNDRPFFAYPYFIAVMGSDGEELAKEIFAASITYGAEQDKLSLFETINQQLPLNDDGSLPGYEVHIGFQLTDEQLFHNASQ